jgi:mono/diheme cytochrome c family protein
MKSCYIFSVLVGVAAAFVGTATATEVKKANGAMKVNIADPMVTPHYKPTGKPPSATRGQAIFLDHCALCHGIHGKGDGPRSAFFVPGGQYIPDMTFAAVTSGRDKELLGSIREGLRRLPEPAYVMPQFKYILSDEEIQSVLAYVKTLSSRTHTK